jgi:hypothetical protein
MKKNILWLTLAGSLCTALVTFLAVENQIRPDNGTSRKVASNNTREPSIAAAKACEIQLIPVENLDFGAVVGPFNGHSSVSIDTEGKLVVTKDHSVGVNIKNYAPSYGRLELNGTGFEPGKRFEIRFIPDNTNSGLDIADFDFKLLNPLNLRRIGPGINNNTLQLEASDNQISLSLIYGATLTIDSTVRGTISPMLRIEIEGDDTCYSI